MGGARSVVAAPRGAPTATGYAAGAPRVSPPGAAGRASVYCGPMRSRWLASLFVVLVSVGIMALIWWAPHVMPGLRTPPAPRPGRLPSLSRLVAWQGGGPFTDDSLRGRPVAMLVWYDTDPASLAALDIADAWHRAFAPLGARVFAVHVPEFEFATDSAVARRVARRLGVVLPMADDSSGFVDAALNGPSHAPHLVVADGDGRMVVDTVADMVAGEQALRAMIRASHPGAVLPPSPDPTLPTGVRFIVLGAGQVEHGPLRQLSGGHEKVFTAEFRYQEQGRAWTPYPVGGWRSDKDGATSTRGGAANFMAIRYSAGRAGVVATPPPGATARLWILRDDRWPRADERGDDVTVDARGAAYVLVTEPRLYWIDRGEGERVLKLSPESPGVTLNELVFTGAR